MLEPAQIGPARKRLGLTQSELARRSGVSQSLIAKIEANRLDPSYSKWKALSEVLERLQGRPALTAERVMHRDVVLMFATDTVEQAIDRLAHHGISQVPVFDEGALVGTVTEASLLSYLARHRKDAFLAAPLRDVMTEPLPQVPPDTPQEGLVPLLELFPAVLVAANRRIQGIVTRSDLLRNAKESLHGPDGRSSASGGGRT